MESQIALVTYAAPEIEIKRTIIRDNNLAIADKRGVGLKVFCGDSIYSQPSIMLKNVLFSSNINCRLSTVLPSVVYMEFAQNVSFVDCSFTGNRGTPIVAYSSHFNVSGLLNLTEDADCKTQTAFNDRAGHSEGSHPCTWVAHLEMSHKLTNEQCKTLSSNIIALK